MSKGPTNDDGEDEITTVNFKITESFLEQIDDTWQGRGFNSRSEFIRHTLRDAVEFPTFDRDELVALLEAEEDIRDGRATGAQEAHERFGTSATAAKYDDGKEFDIDAWAEAAEDPRGNSDHR